MPSRRPGGVRLPRYRVEVEEQPLSEEERQILLEQYSDVHADSQKSYDLSVRAIAALGVGATMSFSTASGNLGGFGLAALIFFALSLGLTLGSYWTVQRDMLVRVRLVYQRDRRAVEWSGWAVATTGLNALAGLTLAAGVVLLVLLVSSSTAS